MTTEQIRQQQATGFRNLRFAPVLEEAYRQSRASLIRQRARPVSVAGLILFLIYAIMDALTLPPELATITVSIRLAITCPVIAVVVWLAHRTVPSDSTFERIYTLAYLLGGLSVVAIIAAARQIAFPLPYEGMILMLMFGYFAMGLPFFSASMVSLVLVISYLLTELWSGMSGSAIATNLFFLTTANVIGMVGAWTSEYRHRAHFLDRQLLNRMHQAARDESRRKTELITAASHDLRQPLNVIDITLESLTPGKGGSGANSATRQLKDMIRHLRRLLGTVFDSARLNEGMIQADIRPTPLATIFRDIGDLLADSVVTSEVNVEIDHSAGNLRVMADPSLLSRVLQNLVFNAVQHSGGSTINLSAQGLDTQVLLEVSDNGIGLPDELNDTLFSPYVRGQGQTDYPGLGLGLTIVREFVALMRGTCGVETEPGQGSVFWVRLPSAVTTTRGPEPDSRTLSGCEHQAG
ncbi:HAMP domain-containing histidine kinase [Marinobacter sp. BW6]|uniref:sensor histidine kinase n=1 Tax=Marinobacter sp. BW6 TaxID=2592624 RepID=UPI0011DEDCA6|nr:HAMP domain-containing sensor histidine kinase [Marinobacter sp. BW6]TYC57201.1 HAMP domain-containing histidine kinase [Marinobacter sp. BW6]